MTQTAVEWLLEKVCNEILDNEFINKLSIEKTHLFNKISIQAKAMEKEQIKEAYCKGDDNIGAETYYNETYKK